MDDPRLNAIRQLLAGDVIDKTRMFKDMQILNDAKPLPIRPPAPVIDFRTGKPSKAFSSLGQTYKDLPFNERFGDWPGEDMNRLFRQEHEEAQPESALASDEELLDLIYQQLV